MTNSKMVLKQMKKKNNFKGIFFCNLAKKKKVSYGKIKSERIYMGKKKSIRKGVRRL